MCGICGVIDLRGDRLPVSQAVLDRMTDAMSHRGPNDRGTVLQPGIALGARRLSIIDVADGHQPFASEDGQVWAAQNGELYNHDELRDELRRDGHRFASRCDTEILPHLYERDGVRVPELVSGKFAIAIWDSARRRALLARDRLGVKPLYYALAGERLIFGSELKSVLASGLVEPQLDYDAIDAYLTFGYVPGPATPLATVRKLPPGHKLVVERGKGRISEYWSYPEPVVAEVRLSEQEYAEGLLERLDRAVRRRLMSDVPVEPMLSGGLDSSLIVALCASLATPSNVRDRVHRSGPRHGARRRARGRAAVRHGPPRGGAVLLGRSRLPSRPSLAPRRADGRYLVDRPVRALEARRATRHRRPLGPGSRRVARRLEKHRAAALVDRFQRLPAPARRAALAAGGRTRLAGSRGFQTLAAPDNVARQLAMSGRVDAELRQRLYRGRLAALDGDAGARAVADRLPRHDAGVLASTLHVDGTLALVDDMLQYFDRVSMAHSLEVRVPFLDHELVEYCAAVPPDLKVHGMSLTTKHLLKRAARDILPKEVVHKRKLGFFRPAAAGWLEAQIGGTGGRYLTAKDPAYAQFLDRDGVVGLVHDYTAGDRSHVFLLTSLMMLEVWLQTYVERARSTEALPEAQAV